MSCICVCVVQIENWNNSLNPFDQKTWGIDEEDKYNIKSIIVMNAFYRCNKRLLQM